MGGGSYIMCYCLLAYCDQIILDISYIKMACIIFFLTNIESVIYWYFLSKLFKGVKKLYKL